MQILQGQAHRQHKCLFAIALSHYLLGILSRCYANDTYNICVTMPNRCQDKA